MQAAEELLRKAEQAAQDTEAWADLSNLLFNPVDGLVSKAYPTREQREEFVKTEEYRKIRRLIEDSAHRAGLTEASGPKKSGRFVVRLPGSLHEALEREASLEGVSLNQLVLTKLAAQLSHLIGKSKSWLAQAFLEVRDLYSVDKVVADPVLDRRFLDRCRKLGATGTDFDLNWALLCARKDGLLPTGLKTRRFSAAPADAYEYACEIAIRHVQRMELKRNEREVSLDRIICDPDLARRFDEVASKLGPGYTSLDYRWTALGLRKASRLKAKLSQVRKHPQFDLLGPTGSIKASQIPKEEGLYLFRSEGAIFVGETDNLRQRIERHFDTGGSTGFPGWLYEADPGSLRLLISPLPGVVPAERKVLEFDAIKDLRPIFNLPVGDGGDGKRKKRTA